MNLLGKHMTVREHCVACFFSAGSRYVDRVASDIAVGKRFYSEPGLLWVRVFACVLFG